jgi:hypothetical protein
MKNPNISAVALAIGLAFSASAMAEHMSKTEYESLEKNIDAEYRSSKAECDSLAGNANDICMADAKGKKSVAKADLEDAYKPTIKTRYKARVAKADADYSGAIERCDDKAGNDKDVCVKEAKAARVHGQAGAEAQMKTRKADAVAIEKSTAANSKAMKKAVDAHNDAAADEVDADYAVAKEKCDVLAGDAKGMCLKDAKARFGKS